MEAKERHIATFSWGKAGQHQRGRGGGEEFKCQEGHRRSGCVGKQHETLCNKQQTIGRRSNQDPAVFARGHKQPRVHQPRFKTRPHRNPAVGQNQNDPILG